MQIINNPNKSSVEEIEQLLLSIILNDSNTISDVIVALEPQDFSDPSNRALYAAIIEYYNRWNKCDTKLLLSFIENNDKYNLNNPRLLIQMIMNLYTNSYDLAEYVDFIKMNSTITNLKKFGEDIKDLSIDYYKYNDEIWDLQKKFLDIINSKGSSKLLTTSQVTKNFLEKLETIKLNSGKLTGTTSGYKSIDEFTNGFHPGDLIILAARPSIGKTALALNMLLAAAKECKENECVVFFSLEMGSHQLIERLISSETSINSNVFRRGTWQDEDEFIINECARRIDNYPIFIDESSNITILEIQTKLKQISSSKKIKLVIVDYLQLVQGSQKAGVNRQQEVSQISRTLKSIARDLDTPIISVAQLSRKIEERKGADKKPILSDLRESGSIEQDADMVVFLNYERGEVDESQSDENTKQYSQTVLVDFIIAKNRNGPTGEAKLLFEKQFGRYTNYSN